MAKHKTPKLDQLESGPWPSFVSDIKQESAHRHANPNKVQYQLPADTPDDLLGVLELSYNDGETHWKHGGIVGIFGYGGGVIGRYCDQPDMFPSVAHFHTLRLNQPAAKYYKTEFLRGLCDIWDMRGSGLTNMHGSTGDIILLGTTTQQLEEIYYELTHKLQQDLGGSGSNMRTPESCLGQSRCQYACFDSQDLCYQLTMDYQDELHRPGAPYKFKIKVDACPNGCVSSIARSDFSIIGIWKDDLKIDQSAVASYVGGEKGFAPNAGAHSGRDWGKFDIQAEVISRCPSKALTWNGSKLTLNGKECVHCMHCINVMPRALRTGNERGACILVGGKAPVLDGPQMGSLLAPFVEVKQPYTEVKNILESIWDWWGQDGKNRERVGETIRRLSFQRLLEVTGIKANAVHVKEPRHTPYMFFKEEEVGPNSWTRDLEAYRKRHPR